MLVSFSLENYRSYRKKAVLSMEPGERLRKYAKENTLGIAGTTEKFLKSVALFGANGSGKSTVVKGLELMREMVLRPTQDIGQPLPFEPFRLDEVSERQPTRFEAVFVKADVKYIYCFAYTESRVVAETLQERRLSGTRSKTKTIFQRTADGVRPVPKGQGKAVKGTRPNSLLLYSLQTNNFTPAVQVFDWFRNDLIVFDQQVDFTIFDNGLLNDERVKKELNNFLRAADINIVGLGYREVAVPKTTTQLLEKFWQLYGATEIPAKQPIETSQRFLYTIRKRYDEQGRRISDAEIPLSAESTGTQRVVLIALAMISSQIQGNQKTVVFDEFEEGLHVEMAVGLLNLFNSVKNQNQFILATHQLELLDARIRTDQIYFTEKNYRGESDLYALFDYGASVARSDVAFSKRYIKGQFGAIPVINLENFHADLNQFKDEGNLGEYE